MGLHWRSARLGRGTQRVVSWVTPGTGACEAVDMSLPLVTKSLGVLSVFTSEFPPLALAQHGATGKCIDNGGGLGGLPGVGAPGCTLQGTGDLIERLLGEQRGHPWEGTQAWRPGCSWCGGSHRLGGRKDGCLKNFMRGRLNG